MAADPAGVLDTGIDVGRRTIYLIGEVNDDTVRRTAVGLRLMEKGAVTVILASDGGDVDAAFAVYDLLKTSGRAVLVEGYGHVQSAAVLILQAASPGRRLLSPETRLMTHGISTSVADAESGSLASIAAEVVAQQARMASILAARCGLSMAEATDLCSVEHYLSADVAVALGLADGVIGA